MMSRLHRFLMLAELFLIVVLSAMVSAEANQPNIVVFLVDDMGMMDTSVPFLTDSQGQPKSYPLNRHYRTPSMERLASQGIRFNNFYAMSVCSPTRISIMTGQNAARHRATNWINPRSNNRGPQGPPEWKWQGLDANDLTLPKLMQQAGYRTIHIGKGHFGPDGTEGAEPLNLGFDRNVGGASFGAPGSYYAHENYGWGTKREHHAVPHLKKYHGSETFLTEALTIEAKELISECVAEQQPFYLYMSQYAVHGPFHSDPRFAANYKESGKPAPAQAFATLIEGMDKSLGDLLDHLEEKGVAENTLILFMGDNGSDGPLGHEHAVACAAPLRGKKGAHYEGGMRVPFIAAWAKRDTEHPLQKELAIPAGAIHSQLAAVTDLLPTLCDVVGVEVPAAHQVDGQSMRAMLSGKEDASHRNSFLMHYPHSPHRSTYFTCYREGDWKVIYHYVPGEDSGNARYQLFNLRTDPFESSDLATDQPGRLTEMVAKLTASLEKHEALYPVSKDGRSELKPLIP